MVRMPGADTIGITIGSKELKEARRKLAVGLFAFPEAWNRCIMKPASYREIQYDS